MKNIRSIASLILLTLLCGFAPADWVVVQNNEGRFHAQYPKAPEVSIDTAHTDMGPLTWKVFMYVGSRDKDDNSLYGVSFCDYPPDKVQSGFKDKRVETFFDKILTTSLTGISGQVISQDSISYKEYPGRHLKIGIANGKAVMEMKVFLVQSRCYILQVGYSLKKENNPSIEKFFSSFEVLN